MKKFILLFALLSIFASSQKTGGTAANSGVGTLWVNPTSGQACDNSYATCALITDGQTRYLLVTNFGFTIPTGATIDGVVAEIDWYATQNEATGIYDQTVQLVKSGTAGGDNKATLTVLPTSEATSSYGGASDTWAAGFTYTDWNTSTSGIRIKAFQGGGATNETVSLDCVRITVYYTEVSGTKRYLIGMSKTIEVI